MKFIDYKNIYDVLTGLFGKDARKNDTNHSSTIFKIAITINKMKPVIDAFSDTFVELNTKYRDKGLTDDNGELEIDANGGVKLAPKDAYDYNCEIAQIYKCDVTDDIPSLDYGELISVYDLTLEEVTILMPIFSGIN